MIFGYVQRGGNIQYNSQAFFCFIYQTTKVHDV